MNAQPANSQFPFQLPSMSYIDAKWEEPELRSPPAARQPRRIGGLDRVIAAFKAWRQRRQAMAELQVMTDRELMDIGLTRDDIGRVFAADLSDELRRRGQRG